MMPTQRKFAFFLAGLTLLAVACLCGYGAAPPAFSGGAGATPTFDLSQPSGGGGGPFATPTLQTEHLVIAPTGAATQITSIPIVPPPAIPESRRLTLEYPPKIRTGDSDVIRLTLEVDTLSNLTPTAEVQGNTVTGTTVQIPNLYDTHYVIAEARLDLAGLEVRPPDTVSEPLAPGQSVTFYWSVRPTESGTYRGTAWLFLRFVDKVSGAESQNALSAQTVQIEATDFLGLSGNTARAAGGVGSVLGAILGFPFVDDALKWLWGRLGKRR